MASLAPRWAPLALLLVLPSVAPPLRADAHRLVIGLSVMPQLEQFIGEHTLPVETYRGELLYAIGRSTRLGADLSVRRDFVLAGGSVHLDLWETEATEWRLGLGLGYVLPLGASESIHRAFTGSGSTFLDRLHIRVAVGQTFGKRTGGPALRIEYGARLMRRDALLSVLEAMDDDAASRSTFLVHEIVAGVELRWGER